MACHRPWCVPCRGWYGIDAGNATFSSGKQREYVCPKSGFHFHNSLLVRTTKGPHEKYLMPLVTSHWSPSSKDSTAFQHHYKALINGLWGPFNIQTFSYLYILLLQCEIAITYIQLLCTFFFCLTFNPLLLHSLFPHYCFPF